MTLQTKVSLLKVPNILQNNKPYSLAWDIAEMENDSTKTSFTLKEIQDRFGYSFTGLKKAVEECEGEKYIKVTHASKLERKLRRE